MHRTMTAEGVLARYGDTKVRLTSFDLDNFNHMLVCTTFRANSFLNLRFNYTQPFQEYTCDFTINSELLVFSELLRLKAENDPLIVEVSSNHSRVVGKYKLP